MFQWDYILIKRLFTSLALLFDLSLRDVSSEIEILVLSDFSESARSIISIAIWLDVLLEFKSLVPQYNIMRSGSKSGIVGFAWLCIHLTLAEINGGTLTRHLWFSFCVSKKTFYFFTMLSPSIKTVSFEVGDDGVLYYWYYFYYCIYFHYYYYYYYYCCCYCYCQFYYIF